MLMLDLAVELSEQVVAELLVDEVRRNARYRLLAWSRLGWFAHFCCVW